jgi:2-polyprenyl-3-methyl-5-hydroxy-6-metoxy-1,4-benzoquinol methylase
MKFILNLIYEYYKKGHYSKKGNFLNSFHTIFFSSKRTIKYLFGFNVYDELHKKEISYPRKFDLTTILLKTILNRFLKKSIKDLEILEVGTGYYSLLSIYLKKKYKHQITATDIDPNAIISSKLNCEKNNVNIELIVSDLFENINDKKFDIIFWNLPYYADVNIYLKPFLNQVSKYLNTNAKIFLGYNSTPLNPEIVINLTKDSHGIMHSNIENFFWNHHKISVISKINS